MKYYKLCLLLLIAATAILNAQPQPLVGSFKVSAEDSSGRFTCSSPELYAYDSSSFIITWLDNRSSNPAVFAQRLNAFGQLVGKNFRLPARESLFLPDKNKIVCFKTDYGYSPFSGSYSMFGFQIQSDDSILLPLRIVFGYTPPCIRLFSGIYRSGFSVGNSFRLFQGTENGRYFTYLDSLLHDSTRTASENYAFGVTSFKFNENYYALIRKNIGTDTLNCKMTAQIYSMKDSLVKDSVQLIDLNYNRKEQYNRDIPRIHTMRLADGNCFVAYMLGDTLYTTSFSKTGTVTPVKRIFFRAGTSPNSLSPINFVISTIKGNSFDILVTAGSEAGYTSKVYSFTTTGIFISETNAFPFAEPLNGNLVKTGDGVYFSTIKYGYDIYLAEFRNFAFTPIVRVNETPGLSNEINAITYAKPDGNFFAIWNDGSRLRGRSFTPAGTVLNDLTEIPSRNMAFYSSGAALFIEKTATGSLLLKRYTKNMNFVSQDTLRLSGAVVTGISAFALKQTPTQNALLFTVNSSGSFLVILDSSGTVVAETQAGLSGSYAALYQEGTASFTAAAGSGFQKFNYALQPVSPAFPLFTQEQVSDNVFAVTATEGFPYYATLCIDLKRSDRTVVKRIYPNYFTNTTPYALKQLTDNRLGAVTVAEGKLMFAAYDSSGTVITPGFAIQDQATEYFTPDILVNNNKVYITWSDNRSGTADVYCKIYSLGPLASAEKSDIPTLPSNVRLSEPYPNPFNDVTNIKYSVPVPGEVTIGIYNALGQQVQIITNEYKSAGVYTATIHRNNLPSGIYYIRMASANTNVTRKCLLVK